MAESKAESRKPTMPSEQPSTYDHNKRWDTTIIREGRDELRVWFPLENR